MDHLSLVALKEVSGLSLTLERLFFLLTFVSKFGNMAPCLESGEKAGFHGTAE